MGAAVSPLVWARVAALISRLTQYLFESTELAAEVFVDDPCLTISGSAASRRRAAAIVILFWRVLGFPLQFKKGQFANTVRWIGWDLFGTNGVSIATIKPEIIVELLKQITAAMAGNVISIKDLQKLAGRANHIAGVIVVWRPFLQQLWAALAA